MKNILSLVLLFASLISGSSFAVTANKVWRIAPGASVGSWGPVNLGDQTNAITGQLGRANLPTVGQQISSSSGSFTTASNSFVDVTNLSVTITTTGRPVILAVVPDGVLGASMQVTVNGSSVNEISIRFVRGSTEIAQWQIHPVNNVGGDILKQSPSLLMIDPVSAGSYTYKVQVMNNGIGALSIGVSAYKLVAYEL